MDNFLGWVVIIGIATILGFMVYWAVASRLKSRRWGRPVEFAGTMVDPDGPRRTIADESEAYQAIRRAKNLDRHPEQ
jgi:hypothetical protein